MFRIGDFSKISQVSMRSLRHYDEIGLFRPAHVDPQTGYRYYSADQLPQLNRIIALKDLGLSLEEIVRLARENPTASDIRALLLKKESELRLHVEAEQARLARVETRLRQIEAGQPPAYEAVLKKVAAQKILSIREVAPNLARMGEALSQAYDAVRQQGLHGPGLAIFYDGEFEDQNLDWEVGFLVEPDYDGQVSMGARRMTPRWLPPIELAAAVVYQGSYPGLHQGYGALGSWIEANGYQIAGLGREVFLYISEDETESHVTEIQFPVEKAAL